MNMKMAVRCFTLVSWLLLIACRNISSGNPPSYVQLENEKFGASAEAARDIVRKHIQTTRNWNAEHYRLRVGGLDNGLMVVAVDWKKPEEKGDYFGSDKNSFIAFVDLDKKSVVREMRGQ